MVHGATAPRLHANCARSTSSPAITATPSTTTARTPDQQRERRGLRLLARRRPRARPSALLPELGRRGPASGRTLSRPREEARKARVCAWARSLLTLGRHEAESKQRGRGAAGVLPHPVRAPAAV